MDIKTKEQRSQNMAAIKSKDTEPEKYLRSTLFKRGFRYRKNNTRLPGKPDIWLTKYKTAIFVHGCFWHRHKNCKYAYNPKTHTEFWETKFSHNTNRDARVKEALTSEGIKCLIVWECTIRNMKRNKDIEYAIIDEIINFLKSELLYLEI